jgi:polyphosphate kinase
VEGLSENIHVRSIIGRYLEHMRIFYFHNNGKKDLFISSADLMTRNMENRIELAVKITDTISKNKITKMLELQLKDNVKARQNIQGKYEHVPHDEPVVHAQLDLYNLLY